MVKLAIDMSIVDISMLDNEDEETEEEMMRMAIAMSLES